MNTSGQRPLGYMPSFEDFMNGIKQVPVPHSARSEPPKSDQLEVQSTLSTKSEPVRTKPIQMHQITDDDQLEISSDHHQQPSTTTASDHHHTLLKSPGELKQSSYQEDTDEDEEAHSDDPSYKKFSHDEKGKFNIDYLIDHHKDTLDGYAGPDEKERNEPAHASSPPKPSHPTGTTRPPQRPPPLNTAQTTVSPRRDNIPTPNSSLLISSRKQKELASSFSQPNEFGVNESTTSDEMYEYDNQGLITSMVDDLIQSQDQKSKSLLELHDLDTSNAELNESPFDDEEIVGYLDQIQKRSQKSSPQHTPQKEPIEILDEHGDSLDILGKTLTFRQVALLAGLIRGYKTRYRFTSRRVADWKQQLEDTKLFKQSLATESDQNPFLVEQLGKQYARIQSKLIEFVNDIDGAPFVEPRQTQKKAITLQSPPKQRKRSTLATKSPATQRKSPVHVSQQTPSPHKKSPIVTPPLDLDVVRQTPKRFKPKSVEKRPDYPQRQTPPLYPPAASKKRSPSPIQTKHHNTSLNIKPKQNNSPLQQSPVKKQHISPVKKERVSPLKKQRFSPIKQQVSPQLNSPTFVDMKKNSKMLLEEIDLLKKNVSHTPQDQDDSLSDFHLDDDTSSLMDDDQLDSVNRILAERQAALASPYPSKSPMFFTESQIHALKAKLQPDISMNAADDSPSADADTTAKEALLTQMHSRALSLLMDADTKSYDRLLGSLFSTRHHSSLPQFTFDDLMNQYGHAHIQPSTIQNLLQYNASNYLR